MTIKIGVLDSATHTVPVTFTLGEIEHKRPVNAVIKENGTHDRAATVERVNEVARGVAEKIKLGVIRVALPPPDPE
ncbi:MULTISPECIES: hypothetical protein [unclassified Sphingobium]|uniref:hypothetical protein n=1 Tax=unclassified Sphingobium TaxID=2611147 RepID=UPI0022246542|nr:MULTISPECIES: hypothetical protein [unclassified Sphingobium]MCW2396169.1 hypothetical protein [Sphingobium sp. B8D3B]MCW2419685.1 hypothetical protein [Sphingobium sp. B8D3C]